MTWAKSPPPAAGCWCDGGCSGGWGCGCAGVACDGASWGGAGCDVPSCDAPGSTLGGESAAGCAPGRTESGANLLAWGACPWVGAAAAGGVAVACCVAMIGGGAGRLAMMVDRLVAGIGAARLARPDDRSHTPMAAPSATVASAIGMTSGSLLRGARGRSPLTRGKPVVTLAGMSEAARRFPSSDLSRGTLVVTLAGPASNGSGDEGAAIGSVPELSIATILRARA